MKIVKINNLVINVEELCCFEVSDIITMNYVSQQRIDFYFKNGNVINTEYNPESVIKHIVERICNIMEG